MSLKCMRGQTLCVVRGQALDIEIAITDQDGNAPDLTGATATFGIAPDNKTTYQETLTATISGETLTAELTSAISGSLAPGNYYFSAWVHMGSDDTPVALGKLTIQPDARTA